MILESEEKQRISSTFHCHRKDLDRWEKIMHGLGLHVSEEGIVEQFNGYFNLKELDWDHYRKELR